MVQIETVAVLAMMILIPAGVELLFATRPQNGIGLVMPLVTLFFALVLAWNTWHQGGGWQMTAQMFALGLIPTLVTGGIYCATGKIRRAKREGTYQTRAQKKANQEKKKP